MSCKPIIRMESTDDYDALVKFFMANDLEFSEDDDPVENEILKCWKMTHGQGELAGLIGGLVLALREDEYIIDGIAVDPIYRKRKLGEILLKKAVCEVKERGGSRIFLVARAPEFFRKHGFITVPRDEAPNFFECLTCPQYGKDCHPEVMRLDLD